MIVGTRQEYMCVNEREGGRMVEEVKVDELRDLVSVIQNNGDCSREVKKRV